MFDILLNNTTFAIDTLSDICPIKILEKYETGKLDPIIRLGAGLYLKGLSVEMTMINPLIGGTMCFLGFTLTRTSISNILVQHKLNENKEELINENSTIKLFSMGVKHVFMVSMIHFNSLPNLQFEFLNIIMGNIVKTMILDIFDKKNNNYKKLFSDFASDIISDISGLILDILMGIPPHLLAKIVQLGTISWIRGKIKWVMNGNNRDDNSVDFVSFLLFEIIESLCKTLEYSPVYSTNNDFLYFKTINKKSIDLEQEEVDREAMQHFKQIIEYMQESARRRREAGEHVYHSFEIMGNNNRIETISINV